MIFWVSYSRNPPNRTNPPYTATEYSPAPMAVDAGKNHVPVIQVKISHIQQYATYDENSK